MKLNLLYVLSTLFISTTAMAGPIYSTSCPEANKIKSPPNSGGYFMDKACTRVYLLPPAVGKMSVIGKTVGDVSRCKEIKSFTRALRLVNNNINKGIRANVDEEKLKDLFDQRRMIVDEYSDLSKTLGASIGLLFSNGIEDNVRAYKKLNSNLGLEFVSVQLRDTSLSFNQANPFDPELKSIVNQSLPLLNLSNVGPGSFSVNANLNLFGACPLVDPFEGVIVDITPEDVAGIVTPNLVYKYEMGATYQYKASYNLAALAKKIVNSSTKGGLFKTSTSATLTESNDTSSWFKFEMTCDDSRVCDQAKQETSLQIKTRLMKEVLDQISLATMGYTVTPAQAGEPGRNGASTAAEGLRKCSNAYCQSAAVVLDVASSIFGGTSKTDQFIKSHDHFVEEVVSESRPVLFTGMMGFGAKE